MSINLDAVRSAQKQVREELQTTKHTYNDVTFWITYDPAENSYRTQIGSRVYWGFNGLDALITRIQSIIGGAA